MQTFILIGKGQVNKLVTTLFKVKPVRDKKYIKFIKELSCIVCQAPPPSDPHHSETGGRGTKASDTTAIPLCHAHHNELHCTGKKTFATKYAIDYNRVTARLNLIYGVDNDCK